MAKLAVIDMDEDDVDICDDCGESHYKDELVIDGHELVCQPCLSRRYAD